MDQKYRVTNKCKFDIGVTLPNMQNIVIRAGNFQLLTADDITFIENTCRKKKFFAKRMLVPCDQAGKEVSLDQLGAYVDPDPAPHMSDEEIENMLKSPIKKIEAWIKDIDDPVELSAIVAVAKTMDLTAGKLRLLQDKLPDVNLIGE